MITQFEHGYALIIGVDEHSNPTLALPTVKKDVNALHALLINPGRCSYIDNNVKVLLGAESTKQNIEAGFIWLTQKISDDPEATVIIYYSGHGQRLSNNRYFLVPYDVQKISLLPIQGIPAEAFAEMVAVITPPRLLVVLDCCYAAGFEVKDAAFPVNLSANEKVLSDEMHEVKFAPLQAGGGRYILNSSTSSETSLIRSDGQMSVFTYHLIDALNGKGRTHDDAMVLVTDVVQHVVRTVPQTAAEYNGHSQTPYIRAEGVGFPIALLQGGKGLDKGVDALDPLSDPVVRGAVTTVNVGSGATAVGDSNVVAGKRGVAIGGNVSSATITTGDGNVTAGNITGEHNILGKVEQRDQSSNVFNQSHQTVHGTQSNIAGNVGRMGGSYITSELNTAGGSFIGRDVNAGGGDFAGRDRVSGDAITVGDITRSTGIAIGRDSSATVGHNVSGDSTDWAAVFALLLAAIQNAPAHQQAEATQKIQALQAEVAKGENVNDEAVGGLIDDLVSMIPDAATAIGAIFAGPILSNLVGPVTKFVLKRLGIAE